MSLSTRATIIIDMYHPEKYGYAEPTIKSLVDMINSGECKVELASEIFTEPVYIFTQK